MHFTLGIAVELALCVLLAFTLGYCILLERRLASVRKGQDSIKAVIGELDTAITNAGASIRALKATTAGAAEQLDDRLGRARAIIDELSLLPASGERIAQRFDSAADASAMARTAPVMNLPSSNIMKRLDVLRAVR